MMGSSFDVEDTDISQILAGAVYRPVDFGEQ
jgi:hypothetical protein